MELIQYEVVLHIRIHSYFISQWGSKYCFLACLFSACYLLDVIMQCKYMNIWQVGHALR